MVFTAVDIDIILNCGGLLGEEFISEIIEFLFPDIYKNNKNYKNMPVHQIIKSLISKN